MTLALIITPLYGLILGAFFILLSLRVIALRGNKVFRILGRADEEGTRLQRAIRGHANFVEYVPFFLVLMVIAEINGATFELHVWAAIFTIGRLLHGTLFCFLTRSVMMRVGGMLCTFIGYAGVLMVNFVLMF